MRWFRKAADLCDVSAQCSLCICYCKQEGVGMDGVAAMREAVKWLWIVSNRQNDLMFDEMLLD